MSDITTGFLIGVAATVLFFILAILGEKARDKDNDKNG